MLRILKTMDKSYFPELRDYAAMMLMLDSGTRLGETLSAKVTQLNLLEKNLHLPADKQRAKGQNCILFQQNRTGDAALVAIQGSVL